MKTIEYYMSLPYHMEIIPDREEGGYTARFPDLPGCLTCAETIEDLVASAQDAKKTWLTAAIEDGIEIAEPDDDLGFPSKLSKQLLIEKMPLNSCQKLLKLKLYNDII